MTILGRLAINSIFVCVCTGFHAALDANKAECGHTVDEANAR